MAQPESFSFTTTAKGGGLLRVLKNQCGISQAFDPADGSAAPPLVQFDAIWDTGATGCVITQKVVDACGLKPIRMAEVHGVHGSKLAEVYLVNIYLPNHVAFARVHVTKGELPPDTDLLIGMEIINRGDFSVTNKDGITKFSFRVPSLKHIDYVQEHNEQVLRDEFKHGGSKKDRRKKPPKTFGKNKHKKK